MLAYQYPSNIRYTVVRYKKLRDRATKVYYYSKAWAIRRRLCITMTKYD